MTWLTSRRGVTVLGSLAFLGFIERMMLDFRFVFSEFIPDSDIGTMALTMADSKSAPLGSLMREMLTGTGGVNVVLTDSVRRMHTRERERRKGGVLLAHVKGHSGDAGNDRADSLCELGKGNGPYSQQKAFVQGESADATARRIAEGEGYPHEAVPGEFACAWSTEKQRLAMNSDQASAQPPLSAKVGTSKAEPRSQLSPDYGSGVRLNLSWKDNVNVVFLFSLASAARARWRWQQSRSKHPSVVLLSCPTPASRAAPALRRSRGGRRHGCSLRGSAARTSAAVRPGQFGGQLRRCSLAHVAASLFLMQRAVAEAVLLLGREEAAAVAV